MKHKTSLRYLLFVGFAASFFILTSPVLAQSKFDPTQDYSIHTMPVLADDESLSAQWSEKSSEAQVTHSAIENTPAYPSWLDQFLNTLRLSVLSVGQAAGTAVKHFFENALPILKENALMWMLQMFLLSAGFFFLFTILQSSALRALFKRLFKSITDTHIRAIGLVSAVVLSLTTGVAVKSAYQQQIDLFAQTFGWQFNPLEQDLLIIGILLLLLLIITQGHMILVIAKHVAISGVALLPSWEHVVKYLTKETKTAFTETEKECAERIDKCSSLFDKGVILAVNYLPGNMPDLGIDDAIIHWKNVLLKTEPQLLPEPAASTPARKRK
jgi:hypothetical protein